MKQNDRMPKNRLPVLFCILFICIALNGIAPVAAQQIQGPVAGHTPAIPITLTDAERAWIHNHPVVRVCIDPAYPPIESRDNKGVYAGLSLDYLRQINERTGLMFEIQPADDWNVCINRIQKKETDLLSAVYISEFRKDYLLFSQPYYRNSLTIVTKNSAPSGLTLESLKGKSVAVVDGYTSHLILQERYPEIIAVPVPNVETGLTKVAFGSADAYLGDLATATYAADTKGIGNLRVTGEYVPAGQEPYQYAFGVRNDQPELVSVLNKGLEAIPPEEKAAITKGWISPSLTSQSPIDSRLIPGLLVGAGITTLIIIIILFLNHTLKQQVALKTADLKRELDQRRRTEEALRESEERNTAIITAMPDLLFILSRDGKYLDAYASKEALLSRPKDTIIGSKIQDTGFDPATSLEILKAIGQALDSGQLVTVSYKLAVPLGSTHFEARLIRLDTDRVLAVVLDITERKRMQNALEQARNKLNLLNTVTFQDIDEAVFSLSAYIELMRASMQEPDQKKYTDKEAAIIRRISDSLKFARNYQDLGMTPPLWQNAYQVYLYAISHVDLSALQRNGSLEGVEIFADPLLEKAFFNIVENILRHGNRVTQVTLGYSETEAGLVMVIEDNGIGISTQDKERIFEWHFGDATGRGLFLVQQILSTTGITLRETGIPGTGARFEITVPKGTYRFTGKSPKV
ncbi:MAG: transporter substrate-binding domain-containing protein [Methanoregula sp.]|nr:transporter substrate-binding domain-containing protein [Methanoregula sp.]